MSRTFRAKNPYQNKEWKQTQDKKRFYKPNKKYKKSQRKRDSTKPKQKFNEAVRNGKDFDGIVIPEPKRHDEWDWN